MCIYTYTWPVHIYHTTHYIITALIQRLLTHRTLILEETKAKEIALDLELGRTGFESCLKHLVAVQPWVSHSIYILP